MLQKEDFGGRRTLHEDGERERLKRSGLEFILEESHRKGLGVRSTEGVNKRGSRCTETVTVRVHYTVIRGVDSHLTELRKRGDNWCLITSRPAVDKRESRMGLGSCERTLYPSSRVPYQQLTFLVTNLKSW